MEVLREHSFLVGLGRESGVLGLEPSMALCQASTLPAVLSFPGLAVGVWAA